MRKQLSQSVSGLRIWAQLVFCLWLKVFHEVTVKQSARLATERFTGEGRDSFPSSLTWFLADLGCLERWASLAGYITTWQLSSSRVNDPRESEINHLSQKSQSFNNLISEVTYCNFCHTFSIRSESIHPGHTQEESVTHESEC